ncbi:Glycine/D-amino acid oxidase (deaminating) [Rubellimicrobium thermophilum DSM 16684]|uniref:Glycine/D-amino acid oxidase (Deaminating) n=1 Tax=Rubellimicrobium thermophilum DSM 16684 TaxID=1123069 RepID=S9R6N6_9RHOB|nr:FAD-binding oxidoreductase [Rubellimicrobium thermophilum]EPX87623.1 Glycine/D-amino acid oxidase (deaminating) [Rubellimicrobium thermophilum DSM 16684]
MTPRRVRRMPVFRGPAAWSAILPGQPAPVALPGDQTVDVAIVGGGFAGLSAARRLRQIDPTARVAVLEAGRLAEGASGRNSGFMIDLPHELTSDDYAGHGDDRAMIALNRHAIAFAREAVQDYGIRADYFDPAGKVNGAASEAADALNRSYAEHLTALGEPWERLDAQAMFELTGSRHYLSGLYTPGTVMLQPAGYIRGLGEGLRKAGVGIWEQTPVTAFARQGGGWTLTTPRGSVSAGQVILANNGHLESFGFARGRLMHVFLYASMTVELPPEALKVLGGRPRWGITPSDPMGTTMRRIDTPLGGHRIVTRSCASFLPGMEPSQAALARVAAVHRAKFADRFPQLAGVRQEYSWAGHLCLTRNAVSIARELEPGLFAAAVCNGLGTTRSTLTGIAAAELAMGQESDVTRHFAAEAEPARLPPEPFASLGANAFLRFREWRARRD